MHENVILRHRALPKAFTNGINQSGSVEFFTDTRDSPCLCIMCHMDRDLLSMANICRFVVKIYLLDDFIYPIY